MSQNNSSENNDAQIPESVRDEKIQKNPQIETDVAVIGGGPAGMAAALKAHEAGLKVTILERDHELGGILQQCIHNGFGLRYFKKELTGPEYAQRFINRIKKTDIRVLLSTMVISLTPNKTITAISSELGLVKVKSKAIILAMGCRERTRGAINIPGSRPAGIFTAGQAQRFINIEGYLPGHRVLILGSGDIGMIMARRCTLEGMKVVAVSEVMPYPSGLTRNKVQCLDDYGIPLYLSHTIIDIRGEDRVKGCTIAKVDDHWNPIPGTEISFDVDTILFSVGLIPENELTSEAGAEIANNGGPAVNEYLQTTIPGVFACGNVLQVHDLVDWVTEEAEMAGTFAAQYVKGELKTTPDEGKESIAVVPGENVGYVKPNRIDRFDEDTKQIRFSYRVRRPEKNIVSELVSDGKVIFTKKHRFVLPSEMIIIKPKLKKDQIGKTITVNVRGQAPRTNIIQKLQLQEES